MITVGKPYIWRTSAYGDIAVHVEKFSPNGQVAVLTIDGGPDATPCRRFPELADGVGYSALKRLFRRAPKVRKETLADHAEGSGLDVSQLDSLTLAQLRKWAADNGFSTITKLHTKAGMLNAIHAHVAKKEGEVTF